MPLGFIPFLMDIYIYIYIYSPAKFATKTQAHLPQSKSFYAWTSEICFVVVQHGQQVVANSLQKPNVASSVQKPRHAINVSQGSFQQPFQQLRPLQPNRGSSQQPIPLGSLKQSSLVSKVESSAMYQDRSLKMSDDKVLVSHILGTHNPHGQEVDAKPFLRLLPKILSLGPRGDLSTDTPLIPV